MRSLVIEKFLMIIIIFTISHQFSYCQVWERTYVAIPGAEVLQLKESYDKGYEIGASIAYGNRYKIGWIIKTDVNGNMLWEKRLGNGLREWDLRGIDNTPDGGMVVIGFTDTLSYTNWNPFIIKLDACGNTEWCRIYCPGNEHFDYGNRIISLADNSFLALFTLWINGQGRESTWLYHLDENGSVIWEQTYFQSDTLITPYWNESLYLTSDDKYLITGTCYTPDSGQVLANYPRPMLILSDSSGEAVWEIPWMNPSHFIGEGFQSIWSGNNFYSAISEYGRSPDTNAAAPCLIKTTKTGMPAYSKKIVETADYGKASTITMVSDNTLFLGAAYDPGYHVNPTLSAFNIDTLGNVRKEKVLSHTDYIPRDALLTHDKKYLITANDWESNVFVIKIWKLNLNLDFDSIYTRPFTYDSLCPHPITSSTLFFQCDVVAGIQESAINTDRVKILIYPNPGREIIKVRMPECIQKQSETEHFKVLTVFHKWTKDLELQVFDIFGKMVTSQTIKPDEKEILMNIASWNNGVYYFRLVYGNTAVATEKFVKI